MKVSDIQCYLLTGVLSEFENGKSDSGLIWGEYFSYVTYLIELFYQGYAYGGCLLEESKVQKGRLQLTGEYNLPQSPELPKRRTTFRSL
jgi:hypothetical protein